MKSQYSLIIAQIFMPLWWFLSYVIPKNKNLYIFGCKDKQHFSGNPKYMFLYVSKHTDKQAVFITKSINVVEKITKAGFQAESGWLRRNWMLLRAHYIFIDHIIYDVADFPILFGNFNIVQLYHGTPMKKIENDTNKNHFLYKPITRFMGPKYCLITCNDKNTKRNYETAFLNENVEILGFPRNDSLYDPTLEFQSQEVDLDLDNYSKVIIYAPTWRDYTSLAPFTEEFLNKLNDYCQQKNYIFLAKQHPYNQQLTFSKERSHITDISAIVKDAHEILVKADLMIVDYSSIFFDYVLTNNPIIFYSYDSDTYLNKNREMYYDYFDILPGPFVQSEDDLLQKIDTSTVWFNDDSYQKKYIAFKDNFNQYQDGNSSKRIYNYLNKSS